MTGVMRLDGLEEKLGLHADKKEVVWVSATRLYKAGFRERGNLGGTMADMPPPLDLEEAYPACALVQTREVREGKLISHCAEIIRLPPKGIGEIDFTHYCIGAGVGTSYEDHTNLSSDVHVSPISFYRLRKGLST